MIENEVMGNKINSKPLYANVLNAISKGEPTIDLEKKNYYINPLFISSSKEVMNTKFLLNKYIASEITYTFTGGKEVLDGSIIHNWIGVNKNLLISFDESKIKSYLGKIDDKYDTYGREREFVTSLGTSLKVSGGTYSRWLVDRRGEVGYLIATIKRRTNCIKNPDTSKPQHLVVLMISEYLC